MNAGLAYRKATGSRYPDDLLYCRASYFLERLYDDLEVYSPPEMERIYLRLFHRVFKETVAFYVVSIDSCRTEYVAILSTAKTKRRPIDKDAFWQSVDRKLVAADDDLVRVLEDIERTTQRIIDRLRRYGSSSDDQQRSWDEAKELGDLWEASYERLNNAGGDCHQLLHEAQNTITTAQKEIGEIKIAQRATVQFWQTVLAGVGSLIVGASGMYLKLATQDDSLANQGVTERTTVKQAVPLGSSEAVAKKDQSTSPAISAKPPNDEPTPSVTK